MNQDNITSIIKQGEGINVEFKKCTGGLSANILDFKLTKPFVRSDAGELLFKVTGLGIMRRRYEF